MLEPRDSVRCSGIMTLVYLRETDQDIPKSRCSLVIDHCRALESVLKAGDNEWRPLTVDYFRKVMLI